ncbi:superfamily II DNA or RNA helicase/transcriptional regulator with XRE-family HTH domain [Povalibacter uvarum]|uniref:Superfamily II DNA or RNA helicase/transcriptional regulator with XRE-family HTH domain n=1 Tax=Povalibacter uvarum TaxID=732238 RepID=A0A841HQX7_9GAMM|nr:SNF2-related protein [Povalibacter uvarum]MBB6095627.1 superfamily II DNA or RNA helicase/transcriptional regulator with XRE-family HTH domain [Povalibacter uvarum]
MRRRSRDTKTLSLFAPGTSLDGELSLNSPTPGRFPLNDAGERVENWVFQDLRDSAHPLIIAGYASLDRFLDFASGTGPEQVRFLIGNEPFASRRTEYSISDDDLPAQAEKYWLARGISLVRSAALIRAIDSLRSGRIEARYVRGNRMLHAKIYCGDKAATVGSSNFTNPGLLTQHEANARFTFDGEPDRYRELQQIAEGFWKLGKPYNDRLIALLEALLKPVYWDEALARACAELLEGEWAQEYLKEDYLSDASSLWPSQKQGIAQALAILDQRGSVLVADATGAGKTRMGVYLVGAIHDQIVRSGRLWHGKALMIAPPTVVENWELEVSRSGAHLDVRSHGALSHSKSKHHELRVEELKRAQMLCVDEGHNFLNLVSQRTQLLLRNMADHVVMLTATPINRGVTDLLRVADVLGADNLDESTLVAFKRMLGRPNLRRSLTSSEAEQLRLELRKFTVRRTKRMLNALIDREPDAYRDKSGRQCRFPKHDPKVYELKESAEDCAIATRIAQLANELKGATHFIKCIEMPKSFRAQGISEEHFLKGRLASAKKLSRYMIMRALRSSRAALVEHIEGTKKAIDEFGLTETFSKDETGNQCQRLLELAGHLPGTNLSVPLPDWLADPELHQQACIEERHTYEQIAILTRRLSDGRESAKVDLLIRLLSSHSLVLAFDSRPISLALIRRYLEHRNMLALLAWGEAGSDREKLLSSFGPGSDAKGIIGLCSDSLAEGVNLQQAAAVVHLDMPSVVRIAEQRVGRVDRLDSPHPSIEAWWPRDAREFALTSDDRLVERFETVDRLIGSNLPLPEHLQPSHVERSTPVEVEDLIKELDNASVQPWDGIDDAFSPVRDLVTGQNSVISPDIYERFRLVTERVLSRVSLVSATTPWAFFCLRAGSLGAPRWILFPAESAAPETELSRVALELRVRLTSNIKNLQFDEHAVVLLNRFLERLPSIERRLLSKRKQRAITQLIFLTKRLFSRHAQAGDTATVEFLRKLLGVLDDPASELIPDWDEVASRWLDVIRPIWFEKLKEKRARPLVLKDIQKHLEAKPDWLLAQIKEYFGTIPAPRRLDERVHACIIGVP